MNECQVVSWANVLGECAVLAAAHFTFPYSDQVLSHLVPGTPSSIASIRTTPAFFTGWFCVCAGSLLRIWTYRTLGRLFTWELAIKENHQLVTSGPYSIVRHPSYTGAILLGVGNLLLMFGSGSWWRECGVTNTYMGMAGAVFWVANWIGIPTMLLFRVKKEDEVLKREFGEKWDAWARSTRYVLVPYIF